MFWKAKFILVKIWMKTTFYLGLTPEVFVGTGAVAVCTSEVVNEVRAASGTLVIAGGAEAVFMSCPVGVAITEPLLDTIGCPLEITTADVVDVLIEVGVNCLGSGV